MSVKAISVPTKILSQSITAAATTFRLNDIEGWDGANLTSASFGTQAYGVFRNAARTQIELFEFDPTTIASADITIVLRGLKYDGDLTTEVSLNKYAWTKGDTYVDIGTDTPQIFQYLLENVAATDVNIASIINAATSKNPPVDADAFPIYDSVAALLKKVTFTNLKAFLKTYFDTLYLTLATGGVLAENASIGLDPAGSADGKYTGITVTGTAGYTQAFGDLVYLDPTDSRWELADADVSTAVDGDPRGVLGMVVSAGTDGTACTVLLHGIIRADAKFPALTVNGAVYVGETAGAIQTAIPTGADNVIRVVGFALTADEIYFNPSSDHQVTVA